jgi:hypothetical protein
VRLNAGSDMEDYSLDVFVNNVNNLFNEAPPFFNNANGYDPSAPTRWAGWRTWVSGPAGKE